MQVPGCYLSWGLKLLQALELPDRALLCCLQGLIHISELSWDRVTRPESVVQPGDKVICKIMRVDEARSRIALSLKVSCLCDSLHVSFH